MPISRSSMVVLGYNNMTTASTSLHLSLHPFTAGRGPCTLVPVGAGLSHGRNAVMVPFFLHNGANGSRS